MAPRTHALQAPTHALQAPTRGCLARLTAFRHERRDKRPNLQEITVDYGKSGYPRQDKTAPRHVDHTKGSKAVPEAEKAYKADLLARMKAAAEAKKAATPRKD